ncbi:MAG: ThiF family adenylyltransferase [Dehalococcoidia bacterium]
MEFQYDEFVRRNAPLISLEAQQRLQRTRLLIAGCGGGSVFAELAVRLGFEELVLVDGDRVELGNINRQVYELDDVGAKKVEALSKRLTKINPHCNLIAVPEFLTLKNSVDIVGMADIVVDIIDVNAIDDILVLHREARRQGKTVVAPIGFGWGAALTIFTPGSVTIDEMFQFYTGANISELTRPHFFELLQKFLKETPAVPAYVMSSVLGLGKTMGIREMVAGMAIPPTSPATSAQLTIAAVVRLALGLPTKVAPDVIHFDPWLALDPSN